MKNGANLDCRKSRKWLRVLLKEWVADAKSIFQRDIRTWRTTLLTRRIRQAAEAYVGKENVVDIDITLGAEDFAYYSQVIPASFYRLGTRNDAKGITSYVHTPTFDIDEDALKIGPGLMAWMAVMEL